MTMSECELRSLILQLLPPDAFKRRPMRVFGGVGIVLGLIAGSILLVNVHLPWPAAAVISIALGNFYVTLMFLGHEMEHGSILRPGRLRSIFQWFTLAIYFVSPHLWKHWHHKNHHAHTNVAGRDADVWPAMIDEAKRNGPFAWFARRIAPGSGHWLSAINFFIAFTLQGQLVLWLYSKHWQHRGFHRARAIIECLSMLNFWFLVATIIGPRASVFVIAIPMLVANFVITAYVTTNHGLLPLVETPGDVLDTTMSVRTLPFLDDLHLHFSHHIEHHLFPRLSHSYYPEVREILQQYAPERYLAPDHWRAVWILYSTPRAYSEGRGFVNPINGSVVSCREIEQKLRSATKGGPVL